MARLRYAALAIGSQGVSRMVPRLTLQQVAPGLACLLDYKFQWWAADLRAGLSVAVANAVAEAKKAAHVVTRQRGGRGAVREICEMILRGQGRWRDIRTRYEIP